MVSSYIYTLHWDIYGRFIHPPEKKWKADLIMAYASSGQSEGENITGAMIKSWKYNSIYHIQIMISASLVGEKLEDTTFFG